MNISGSQLRKNTICEAATAISFYSEMILITRCPFHRLSSPASHCDCSSRTPSVSFTVQPMPPTTGWLNASMSYAVPPAPLAGRPRRLPGRHGIITVSAARLGLAGAGPFADPGFQFPESLRCW